MSACTQSITPDTDVVAPNTVNIVDVLENELNLCAISMCHVPQNKPITPAKIRITENEVDLEFSPQSATLAASIAMLEKINNLRNLFEFFLNHIERILKTIGSHSATTTINKQAM
uniref:Uncharacterized protein n=1 Tax=mine drainage metagenome TaxID=410659 RepID=E6Q001_9ZZZZ